jgi:hypothetical protein
LNCRFNRGETHTHITLRSRGVCLTSRVRGRLRENNVESITIV